MKRLLIVVGALVVIGAVIGGGLYLAFPVPMTTYGGMGLNFLRSLSAPAGTLALATNPAYKGPLPPYPLPPPRLSPMWDGRTRRPGTGQATTGPRSRSGSRRWTRSIPRMSGT